jgi:shikimate kinase
MTGDARSGPAGGPIILVGLMAAGKTTVGRILADRCNLMFIDLDHEIELFASQGESAFRDLEASVSHELADRSDVVVAVGGGWMVNKTARQAWPEARIIWLVVSPLVAALRINSHTASRPLLKGKDTQVALERLLARRLPAYAEALYTVDTDGSSADDVAAEIAGLVGLRFSV